jgi:hypothetical protein
MSSIGAGSSSSQVGQDWTAIKCGRLLRHLTISISALRKEAHIKRHALRPQSQYEAPGLFSNLSNLGSKRKSLDEDGAAISKRKVRRTYSSRHVKDLARQTVSATVDPSTGQSYRSADPVGGSSTSRASIHMATPVAQRLSGLSVTPLRTQDHGLSQKTLMEKTSWSGHCWHAKHPSGDISVENVCHASYCDIDRQRIQVRGRMTLVNLKYYDAVYQHLDALLRATSVQAPGTAAPKSLLAMCLRKVPDYIAEQEVWEQRESESSFTDLDVSSELYWDLESTYGTAKYGWKHLSVVVQSHGIKMVKEAIMEGLIDRPFALLLARVCDQAKAFSDRGQLLEATLMHPEVDVKNAGYFRFQTAVDRLSSISPPKWTKPFETTLMTELLARRLVPSSWILTPRFGNLWSDAVTDMTTKCPNHGTMGYIAFSIEILGTFTAASERSTAEARQGYIDALSVLATMSIMGQNTLTTGLSPEIRSRITNICRRAEIALRTCLANIKDATDIKIRRNAYLLQLALFFAKGFLALPTPDDDILLANFWPVLKMRPALSDQLYGGALALISTIARSCRRRPTDKRPQDYLAQLLDKLEQACPKTISLRKMRIEASFYLAELTGDVADYIYAERLALKTEEDINRTTKTPMKDRAFAGFRWDEGISEWITATPLVTRHKPAARLSGEAPTGLEDILEGLSPDTLSGIADTDTPPTSPSTGKSCRAKASTIPQPWSQTDSGRSDRYSPGIDQSDGPADDLDELSFCLDEEAQEDHRDKHQGAKKNQVVKRKQSRRSLLSIQPLPKASNENYDDGPSDDELGM